MHKTAKDCEFESLISRITGERTAEDDEFSVEVEVDYSSSSYDGRDSEQDFSEQDVSEQE